MCTIYIAHQLTVSYYIYTMEAAFVAQRNQNLCNKIYELFVDVPHKALYWQHLPVTSPVLKQMVLLWTVQTLHLILQEADHMFHSTEYGSNL